MDLQVPREGFSGLWALDTLVFVSTKKRAEIGVATTVAAVDYPISLTKLYSTSPLPSNLGDMGKPR